MPKNLRFWTNVGLIAAAHAAVIIGLIHWNRKGKEASAQSVVWMNGGAGDGIVSEKKNPPATKSPAPHKGSKTEPLPERESEEDGTNPNPIAVLEARAGDRPAADGGSVA